MRFDCKFPLAESTIDETKPNDCTNYSTKLYFVIYQWLFGETLPILIKKKNDKTVNPNATLSAKETVQVIDTTKKNKSTKSILIL